MKAEEPILAYSVNPQLAMLRDKIIERVEQEKDPHTLQQIIIFIDQAQNPHSDMDSPKDLRSLRGILKANKSYQEMKQRHMQEKYAL